MKITMITYGTRGDAQPAVARGQALKAEGHSIRVVGEDQELLPQRGTVN